MNDEKDNTAVTSSTEDEKNSAAEIKAKELALKEVEEKASAEAKEKEEAIAKEKADAVEKAAKEKAKPKTIFRVHCPACHKENDNPGRAIKIECSRCGLVLNVKKEGRKINGTTSA